MLRITFLFYLVVCGLCFGQQTSPMEILFQEELPLRKQVRAYPEAQKAFNHYRLKVIAGSIVGSSGVILLNHSLGSISPRKPHEWAVTGIGAGLVATGLFITKGAKKNAKKPKTLSKTKNKSPLTIILAV